MSPRVWQRTTRHEAARLRAPETPSAGTPRSRSHATRPRRADRKVDDELRLRHHRPAVRTAVPRRGPSEGRDVARSLAENRAPRGGAAPCPGNAISGDTAITFPRDPSAPRGSESRRRTAPAAPSPRRPHSRTAARAVRRERCRPEPGRKPRATTRRGSVTRKRHQRGHCNRVPTQPVRAAQIGEVDDELRLRHHRPRLP